MAAAGPSTYSLLEVLVAVEAGGCVRCGSPTRLAFSVFLQPEAEVGVVRLNGPESDPNDDAERLEVPACWSCLEDFIAQVVGRVADAIDAKGDG